MGRLPCLGDLLRPRRPRQDAKKSRGSRPVFLLSHPSSKCAKRELRRLGAKVDGMANSGELLINVVRSSKPKALRGLNQKVRGQVQGCLPSPVVAVGATGGEAEPKPSMIHP